MNKRILGLALPNIVTNITVPLLGMVDMAIVGHLSADHIGAIAIGTQLFNLIYWNFGFLRMGTSGLTAQAFGAERWDEAVKILIRACAIALGIALTLIVLQWPISLAVPTIFEGSNHVISLALTYFFVRIWAAPATLGMYAIKGWFIGMQDSKTPMWIAIFLNCVNIVASLLFVMVLHWDIAGVALGTVIANYSGLALGILFLLKRFKKQKELNTEHLTLNTIKVVQLKPTDPLFHLLEQIQNEVHRFAITFHKDKRSKGTFRTALTDIPGIGEKTAHDLLLRFGSVKQIQLQTLDDLAAAIGPSKAALVYNHLNG